MNSVTLPHPCPERLEVLHEAYTHTRKICEFCKAVAQYPEYGYTFVTIPAVAGTDYGRLPCNGHVMHSNVMSGQSHSDTTNLHKILKIQRTQKQTPSVTTTHGPDTKQTQHESTQPSIASVSPRTGKMNSEDLCLTGAAAVHLLHQEPGDSPRQSSWMIVKPCL